MEPCLPIWDMPLNDRALAHSMSIIHEMKTKLLQWTLNPQPMRVHVARSGGPHLLIWLIYFLFSWHKLRLPRSKAAEVFYLVGQLLEDNVVVHVVYVAHVLVNSPS